MSALGAMARLLPLPARNVALRWRDRWRLGRVTAHHPWDASRLGHLEPERLAAAMHDPGCEAEWPAVAAELAAFAVTSTAGGVNPGDRRALYYFVRVLRPGRVLEIGTHIGASTVHLAAALRQNGSPSSDAPALTTVDIEDVNDPAARPWLRYGSTLSPLEMVRRLGMSEGVRFVTARSLDFLRQADTLWDLIFLDGDHCAATVYHEIPAAASRLRPGGLILLHDYFPEGRPLWPDDPIIPGPWLGVERLRREGASLRAVPFGDLPWPTKLGRNVTSLAVVARG